MAAKLLSLGLLVSHSPTHCGAHVKAEGIRKQQWLQWLTLQPECGPIYDGKV